MAKLAPPQIETDFENIVPWNGMNDTGYHARKKLERNFNRASVSLESIVQWIADNLLDLDERFLHKDRDDKTTYLLSLLGGAIINKWAPPNENLTATYIENVSRLTGIPPAFFKIQPSSEFLNSSSFAITCSR